MRLCAVLAVLAGSLVGWGVSPANAAQLCEKVWTAGTDLGYYHEGQCQPYTGATLCHWEDAGADPQAHVYTEVCVPSIITEP
jgi:hypothetical protein